MKEEVTMDINEICRLLTGPQPVVYLERLNLNDISDVQVCRVCFATDYKLYKMKKHNNLRQWYSVLTGSKPEDEAYLPPYLCYECSQRLLNCIHFRSRCLRAQLILLEVARNHKRVTKHSIKSVIGNEQVGSHLKVTETLHFDSSDQFKQENDVIKQEIDLIDNADVKIEKNDAADLNSGDDETDDHLLQLHEDFDMQTDTDETICHESNSENSVKYFPKSNLDNTMEKDNGRKGVTECCSKDNFLVNGVVIKHRIVERANQTYRSVIPKSEIEKRKLELRGLWPTNIVKLKKRIFGKTAMCQMEYDRTLHQTINDIPVWGLVPKKTITKPYTCRVNDLVIGYNKELVYPGKTDSKLSN